VILDGTATVSKAGVDKRTLGAGDHFGEISMIDSKRRSATVTATEPLTALAVPHLAFQSLLDDDPTCARETLMVLCARLREAEAQSAD
jgi:CRP/FNR family cyclic AMP-dependent transcriptional regulator